MNWPRRLGPIPGSLAIITLFLGTVASTAVIAKAPQEPGDSSVVWQIDFPAGENQVVRRHTYTRPGLTSSTGLSLVVHIDGPGPILIEGSVGGPACAVPLEFAATNATYDDEQGFYADVPLGRSNFRRLFTTDSPPNGHEVSLNLNFQDGRDLYLIETDDGSIVEPVPGTSGRAVPNAPEGWACELVVRVSRDLACTMWAQVTGDVDQIASGGVAYFNSFANGVPITTGTIADPGMHEMLEGMLEFAQGMSELMEEEGLAGEDVAPSADPGTPSAAGAMQQMRNELFGEGGDKFGLTLTDVNPADAAEQQGDGLMQLAEGLSVLAGAFTLEASAPGGVEILENPDTSIDLESGQGSVISVPLSSLRVVPGGLDGNLNRVPFVYDGSQGSAILIIEGWSEDFIVGQVGGELFTETEYDGRKLSISVAATFAARRGFRSCMR